MLTQDEILDRVVEIIEQYPFPLPEEIAIEWRQLNDLIRELHEPSYGLGFWHKGYTIDFYGSKILYCRESKEKYEDMLGVFSAKMTIKEYNEKWKSGTTPLEK